MNKYSKMIADNQLIIDELSNKKNRIKARLFSFLLTVLFTFSFIVFVCNLYYFYDHLYLVTFILAILIVISLTLYELLYFVLLCNYHEELRGIKYLSNLISYALIYFITIMIIYGLFIIFMEAFL